MGPSAPPPLEGLDLAVATALQVDPRASWRRIARVLGAPERTVARHGAALLESGTVQVAGMPTKAETALLTVRCAPGTARVAVEALAQRPDTTFGVLWVVEPIAYFPVLRSSAMYQAFLIGNISSKLLPAAVVAQDAVKAKPGTARGDVAAVMAICGAATVHLTSLFVFVGLLGTWLVTLMPQDVMLVVSTYILPAVLGAVIVQAIWSYRAPRTTLVALAVGAAVAFLLVPSLAPLWKPLAFLGTPITVILTVVLAHLVRRRTASAEQDAGELHY